MKISGRLKETLAVIAALLGLLVLQRELWITGQRMVSHDSIIWFGAFSYFADCLQHGIMPLWNPYMNSGEIFFLNMHALHLLEPSTIALVFAGKLFKIGTLSVYHFDLLFRYLFFITGSYLFFRRVAKHKFSAFAAFIALAFSSLCSSYLKQHAFILPFYLLPWILLFTFKLLEEKHSMSLIWLALLWGVAFSSYHAMYLITSVAMLLLCIYFSKGFASPDGCEPPRTERFDRRTAFTAFAIFVLLSVNLLPVFLSYSRDTIPTARLIEAPMAAYSYPADFLNLFAPYSFMLHFEWLLHVDSEFIISESFLYIGMIGLFFAAVGLLYSRHKYRAGFAITLALTAALMLGPRMFLSTIFTDYLPLFSIIRNTHTFGAFFLFCLCYFTCIGFDLVLDLAGRSELHLYKKRFITIVILICAVAFSMTAYTLKVYRPPLENTPVVNNEMSSLMGRDLIAALGEIFSRSYYNAFLFIFSIAVIFYMINKPKIKMHYKYATAVLLMLVDLAAFNLSAFEMVTMQRESKYIQPEQEAAYSNSRIPIIWPKYPFFGFSPAMQKKFTAMSSQIPWVTTHLYEMKEFYYFVNDDRIPPDVKRVFMGITGPKLKMTNGAVVVPADGRALVYSKLDKTIAGRTVFIEEDPPAEYSGLKIPLKDIKSADTVNSTIKVLGFGPNNLDLEIDSEKDGFLYYSDGFDRFWRAFVDGKETKVYRTDMAFKSVIVGKGTHAVKFIYDPRLYKATLACYFSGILIAVIAIGCGAIKGRRANG